MSSTYLNHDGVGKPALLFGNDRNLIQRTSDLLTSAGVRLGGHGAIDQAIERLDAQVAVGLVWVECGEAADLPSDALLDRLARLASSGEAQVVASAPPSLLDLLFARLDDSPAQILIDPTDLDRAGALSLALAEAGRPARVSDVGRDNAVRLRQLSDEMGRIAATLARLSSTPDESGPPALRLIEPIKDAPPLSVDIVRSVIRARRLRARFFHEDLFADPAWDMLLDLLQAELAQHRVPVSSLCIAAAVPATTASLDQVDDRRRPVPAPRRSPRRPPRVRRTRARRQHRAPRLFRRTLEGGVKSPSPVYGRGRGREAGG